MGCKNQKIQDYFILRISQNNDDKKALVHHDNDDEKYKDDDPDTIDNDLFKITLKLPMTIEEGTVDLVISNESDIRLFIEDEDGKWSLLDEYTVDIESPEGPLAPLVENGTVNIKAEGLEENEDLKFEYKITSPALNKTDELHVIVSKVDLDVDSDNDNELDAPELNDDEDDHENPKTDGDIKKHPGKIFMVNDADIDFDGIPDYADGFDAFSEEPDDGAITPDDPEMKTPLIPLVLKLENQISPANVKFEFTYTSSDPSEVTRTNIGDAENPVYKYEAPAGFRIWKTNANTRNKNSAASSGDFIPSETGTQSGETKLTATQLGMSGNTVTLYVEATPGSEELDFDKLIKIKVYSNEEEYETDEWVLDDTVRLAPICMQFVTKGENDAIVPTDFVGVCTPRPEVKLMDLTIADVEISEKKEIVEFTLKCNEILDPVADNLPEGVGEIKNVGVYLNGSESAIKTKAVTAEAGGTASFWKQHPYKGKFEDIKVQIPLEEGTHYIQVKTDINAAELKGFDDVSVTIDKEETGSPAISNQMVVFNTNISGLKKLL